MSDCEELVGEVNHTTECVTDLAKINGEGHMKSLTKSKYSYLFVSYILQHLSNHFGGRNKFRVSLKSVIFSESKRLSQSLKIVIERIYEDIRNDMKSTLTIEDVKDILRKEILEGFLGHSHRSMFLDRYGDRFSTEILWKELINKISFDGFKWEDLKIDWKQRIQP